MESFASIDGRLVPVSEARVSVLDNGFTFGDSVYEVLRTYGRRPFEPARHFRRLRASADRLGFQVPGGDHELLAQVSALAAGVPAESYVRVIVTRGLGDCSYNFEAIERPTVVMIAKPLPPYPERHYEEGIHVALVSIRRNHPRSLDPAIKSSNLLNNILAVREARARGADEPLLLNLEGQVAEGASSNVFAVRAGRLQTPPLSAGILAGITRDVVLEIAASLDIPAREAPLGLEELRGADEAFMTSTTREVVPIHRLDDAVIGSGRPGALTRRLMEAFRAYAPAHCG